MRSIVLPCILLIVPLGPFTIYASAEILPADREIAKVIDHYIDAKLKKEGVKAAPPATDAAFLRRLSLDLIGRIPTKYEVSDYLAGADSEKKIKLVDKLLNSASFARHQGERFATLMEVQGRSNDPLQLFLQKSFAGNRPWDDIFRALIVPDRLDKKQDGANEFLRDRLRDLNRLTVDVSSIFFGVNVSCAQCHNHPHVQDWTQDHFYGMKSFFARTFDNGGFVAERSYGAVEYTPNKGKPKTAPVMFLTGKTIMAPGLEEPNKKDKQKEQALFNQAKKQKKPAPPPKFSLREKLVEIALQPNETDFFARAIVNRIWYQYFGHGLIMPLDQMHSENFPSHPDLLKWLARDMRGHDFDLKRLIRGIVLSEAYARSSRLQTKDIPADNLFAVAKIRPLPPMPLARSLLLASTDPESLPSDDVELDKYFENLEGRAKGLAANFAEPGSDFQVSVEEAMFFSNNERIQNDLLQGGNSLVSRLIKIQDKSERAQYAIQTVFGRSAQPNELEALTKYIRERESRPEEACRQVIWALLTSSEFRFNH